MPLLPGKKNVGRNIETEMASGKSKRQAIAIALNVARRASGGAVGYADGGAPGPDLRRQMQMKALAGRELGPEEQSALDAYMANLEARKALKSQEIDEGAVGRGILNTAHEFAKGAVPPVIPGWNAPEWNSGMEAWKKEVDRVHAMPTDEKLANLATQGVIEAAPALPVGWMSGPLKAMGRNPVKTALGIAGLGAAGLASDQAGAQDANLDAIKSLHTQRATLEQRRTQAEADLQKAKREMAVQEKTGRGRLYNEAAENLSVAQTKYNDLSAELSGVMSMIKDAIYRNSPEFKREQEELDRQAREKAEKAEANKTFREKHPYWNAALPAIGLAGAVGVPWVAKGVGQAVRNSPINRMNAAVKETERAIAEQNAARVSDMTPRLNAYKADVNSGKISPEPGAKETILANLGAGVSGGVIGAEARMFPDQWNAAALPEDNPIKEEARKRQLNPWLYLEGMVPGALTSLGSYWKLPVKTSIPRSQDVEGILKKYGTTPESAVKGFRRSGLEPNTGSSREVTPRGAANPPEPIDGGPLSPMASGSTSVPGMTAFQPQPAIAPSPAASEAPKVITRVKTSKGHYTHHDEKGQFTSNPKAKKASEPDVEKKYGGAVGAAMRIARAMGGRVHVGPITQKADGGRTDTVPMEVPANSYVFPADTVSSLGEGDTSAGMKRLETEFGLPHTATKQTVPIIAAGGEVVVSPEQILRSRFGKMANGDIRKAHELLDQFVKDQRAHTIQTLAALPGPQR